VANPPPSPIPNTSLPPILSPLVFLPPALMAQQIHPKLFCPPDFSGECHNGHTLLNSYSLYIRLAPKQFHNKEERILWALIFFKDGHAVVKPKIYSGLKITKFCEFTPKEAGLR